MSGHKRVWVQTCLGTNVSGHNHVWARIKCVWAQTCPGTNMSKHSHLWAYNCVGTIMSEHNVYEHKLIWAQMCLGTNVFGHKCVWAQKFLGTNVSGHKCVGTNVSGHKRVWAQTCVGTVVWAQSCGPNHVWAQTWRNLKKHREATRWVRTTIRIKIHQVPLNLTCSEGNTTVCRSRMKGLRQLNNVSWLLTVKPRTNSSSFPVGSETSAPPGEQRGGTSDSAPNTWPLSVRHQSLAEEQQSRVRQQLAE